MSLASCGGKKTSTVSETSTPEESSIVDESSLPEESSTPVDSSIPDDDPVVVPFDVHSLNRDNLKDLVLSKEYELDVNTLSDFISIASNNTLNAATSITMYQGQRRYAEVQVIMEEGNEISKAYVEGYFYDLSKQVYKMASFIQEDFYESTSVIKDGYAYTKMSETNYFDAYDVEAATAETEKNYKADFEATLFQTREYALYPVEGMAMGLVGEGGVFKYGEIDDNIFIMAAKGSMKYIDGTFTYDGKTYPRGEMTDYFTALVLTKVGDEYRIKDTILDMEIYVNYGYSSGSYYPLSDYDFDEGQIMNISYGFEKQYVNKDTFVASFPKTYVDALNFSTYYVTETVDTTTNQVTAISSTKKTNVSLRIGKDGKLFAVASIPLDTNNFYIAGTVTVAKFDETNKKYVYTDLAATMEIDELPYHEPLIKATFETTNYYKVDESYRSKLDTSSPDVKGTLTIDYDLSKTPATISVKLSNLYEYFEAMGD